MLAKKGQKILAPMIFFSDGVMIPLDIDVSPFDNSKTNKEGVSRTYKGHDGFAPIFAYLGRDGYLVNLEMREGKQHCQNGTVEFLSESIKYSKSITDEVILVRLDSGNDCRIVPRCATL